MNFAMNRGQTYTEETLITTMDEFEAVSFQMNNEDSLAIGYKDGVRYIFDYVDSICIDNQTEDYFKLIKICE